MRHGDRFDRERFDREHRAWMLFVGLVMVIAVVLVIAGVLPIDVLFAE